MTQRKSKPDRGEDTRELILDAAERLLAREATFSMRDLAVESNLSFATPFNNFGGKAAIMVALSARRIMTMQREFGRTPAASTAPMRVLAVVDIAASVMLSAPRVNRAVMGAIGAPGTESGDVASRSSALWTLALGAGEGLSVASRPLALTVLADQLAFGFRGVLSFWTAGDIPDGQLRRRARVAAATLLLGFASSEERGVLLQLLAG